MKFIDTTYITPLTLILLFLIQPFLQKKYAFEYKFRLKRLNYEKKSLKTKLIFLKN